MNKYILNGFSIFIFSSYLCQKQYKKNNKYETQLYQNSIKIKNLENKIHNDYMQYRLWFGN
jgi:hypothetical protein